MIHVKGLLKRHGSAVVLDGITLSVGRGEVLAVIGPSGAARARSCAA